MAIGNIVVIVISSTGIRKTESIKGNWVVMDVDICISSLINGF